MLTTASRVSTLKGSAILEIAAKAAELKASGIDVVSLAAGEPDFNTPEPIQTATFKAVADGITKYAPSQGFLALREALAEKIAAENGYKPHPEEIIVTAGGKHAIFLALQCLCEPGDGVLVPTPGWASYEPMIQLAGASMIPLPLFEEDGFHIQIDRWKGFAVPKNAKGIFINSPNNPSGVVYTREELRALVGWAMQRNLWILSDEIYEKILYDEVRHYSVASFGPEVFNHTVTVSGFSKTYCMTGWRLGWAVAPKQLIEKMTKYQMQSTSHATSFVQMGGLAALKLPDEHLRAVVAEFDRRRTYCMDRMEKWKEWVSYPRPQGAFYFFVNFGRWLKERRMTDHEFCKRLLSEAHVAIVPGASFGDDCFVRFSYATSIPHLEKAFDRMDAFLKA